ncbi:NEUFC-like protein [Mya arenaria]|uniref:NEUFC-like protein n=1 Tax=Mya arenaria TaxID=6604 RepID=A0ABY7DWZ8_MYAAR|nr:neuferricin-like [Mya arenaria]WAR02257.1 NEUFC-like protein [Mya arenaria]
MITKLVLLFSVLLVVISFLLTKEEFKDYRHILLSFIPFFNYSTAVSSGRIFTKEELAKYSGKDKTPVYLAIIGDVFDVTKGRKHYGEGGGYHFFSGKDGTRAFVSGKFTEEGLIEDTTGLSHTDLLGIEDWNGFYKKQYKHIGRLAGLYYNEKGEETEAMRDFIKRLDIAKKAKQSDEDDKQRFPTCNFEYKQGQGRRIWCSTLSGGVQRDWEGVPRQYFQPGKTDPRCACIKDFGPPSGQEEVTQHNNRGDLDNPLMKLYEGCDPSSVQCFFPEDS